MSIPYRVIVCNETAVADAEAKHNYRMKLSLVKLLGPMIKPAKQRSEEIGEDKVRSFSHAV